MTATVRRAGPLGPALSSPLRFTLSPVPGRDDDEVPLALKGGERRGIASGPAADRRQSREATLTIPAGLAPGRWWVRACPAPRARPRLGARVACATSARPLVVR